MYGRSLYFDITHAKLELGWHPRYSNNDMFLESYRWYLENRHKIGTSDGASPHRSVVKHGVLSVVGRLL